MSEDQGPHSSVTEPHRDHHLAAGKSMITGCVKFLLGKDKICKFFLLEFKNIEHGIERSFED